MSWQDRLSEAVYVSPSGVSTTLIYERLQIAAEARGTKFDFADIQGSFIQGTGSAGREFPLRVFFSGDDHDTQSATFLEYLREQGQATLEHPTAGLVTVVPLGRITHRNDLVREANQTVLQFTLWETLTALFPSRQTDPSSEVLEAVELYTETSAAVFADTIATVSGSEIAELSSNIDALVGQAEKYLQPVADATESVSNQFTDISDSITNAVDVLIGEPLTLAFQISRLVQAPARSISLWQDKIAAYSGLASDIIAKGDRSPTVDRTAQNLFYSDDLVASGAIVGAIVGAVNNEFTSQPEAIEAAQEILTLAASLNAWREGNFTALSETDTGEAYQQWQNAASLCAGFLIEISFTLAQERVITTDRNRTIIDLCAELYGSIDDKLDFFINSNALTGDEIIELPKGREIRYYI